MAFHNRLKEARIAAHLTQKDVSDTIGISKSTYSGYETGNSEPSIAIISKLMKLFNVTPAFLLQDEMSDSRGSALSCSSAELPGDTKAGPSVTPDEGKILSFYRLLNDSGKQLAVKTLQNFSENPVMQMDYQTAAELVRQRADEAEEAMANAKAHA